MTQADDRIKYCIDNRLSFLLDAGAGSGKTASLVKALNYIRVSHRDTLTKHSQKVACITFTNVAKDEIIERTEHDPLFHVSTIHDFMWSIIKGFQDELKNAVQEHNRSLPKNSRRKKDPDELSLSLDRVDQIIYSDRGSDFLEGRIFHDDLLSIAQIMFDTHSVMSRIVASRYPFIFVDEYQDTNEKVISLLLNHVLESSFPILIGLFGDKVQSIYDDGVGEIPENLQAKLDVIQKEENYRCSLAVIKLINKIRTDITQRPAGKNQEGMAVYVNISQYRPNEDVVDRSHEVLRGRFGWTHLDANEKILFLTHRLIAQRAGYEPLWKLYNDRGRFYQDRFQSGDDEVSAFLCGKIENLISTWKSGNIGKTLSMINQKERSPASKEGKVFFQLALDELVDLVEKNATIKEVLLHVQKTKLLPILDDLTFWLGVESNSLSEDEETRKFFLNLFDIPYREVSIYCSVLEDHLPYSTKHGVKGDEFDTVLVILDDEGARWNQYSFGNLLIGRDTSDRRMLRTRNLFYVCCSRARKNLAVIDLGRLDGKIPAVQELFGSDFCVFGDM